ncbi:MAG: hypothetical protein Q8Q11_00045 [bacterium]|nr:hypothetical protein [bacterium]MDZ4247888.1 hypothetical protein [Patescibacteria group bacterium]
MKRLTVVCLSLIACLALASPAMASTAVPGKSVDKFPQKYDVDNNGYPDAGVVVVGHYYSVYAYDANGDWYWDLGDGRVQGTVGSVGDLDQATLSQCDYVVNYKGTFENNPFQDSGHIDNQIRCYGYDGNAHYNYQIVHQTDPRYRGISEWSIWGTWEYHVLTESGNGNLVRPENAV